MMEEEFVSPLAKPQRQGWEKESLATNSMPPALGWSLDMDKLFPFLS